jgi:tetratricopeptide (TPR) repeat protein
MRPILERAGGNPLFVLELVEALLERGVIELVAPPEGGDRVVRDPERPIAFPSTLEEVIAGRLDELPEPAREVVRWLAAARAGLREDDLEALASPAAVAAAPALVERGLLTRRPGGVLAFTSAVVRHVAYPSLEPEERARMHRRLARHLASLPSAPMARVAAHFELAGEADEAGAAWLEAGEAAFHLASHEEALDAFERALALLADDPARRFRAHAGRERVLRSLGRRTEQLAELAVMRSIAESARLDRAKAVALTRLARFELDGRRTAGVRALLEAALEAARVAGDEGVEIDTLRLAAELARDEGRVGDGLEACERALARCADRPGFVVQRGLLLVLRGTLLHGAGRLDEAREALAGAVVLFARADHRRYEAYALDALAEALVADGALADAVRLLRASLALDREAGHRVHLGRKLAALGQLYAALGEPEASRRFFARAWEVADALGDRPAHADALLRFAEVCLDDDALDPVASLVASARGLLRPGEAPELEARADLLAARLSAADGAHDRALDLVQAVDEARLASEAHRLERRLLEAEIRLARGDRAAARPLAGALVPSLPGLDAHLRGDRLLVRSEALLRRLDEVAGAGAARRLGWGAVERRAARLEEATTRERYASLGHVRRLLAQGGRAAVPEEL